MYIEVESNKSSIRDLMQKTSFLQSSVDFKLTHSVVTRAIDDSLVQNLTAELDTLTGYKKRLVQSFEDPDIHEESVVVGDEVLLALTTNRVMHLLSIEKPPYLIAPYILKRDPNGIVLYFPENTRGVLAEALRTDSSPRSLIGMRVTDYQGKRKTTLLHQDTEKELSAITVVMDEKKDMDLVIKRQSKNILIAVEGDVAGHATRALLTARGLKNLGYTPRVIGDGYFMDLFEREGFSLFHPSDSPDNQNREQLISYIRGEGKGLFPWSFRVVSERSKQLEDLLSIEIQRGIDLLVSDMDPISLIVLERLGRKFHKGFMTFTQTHDLSFSPDRPLRSLKLKNVPVGRWSANLFDPGNKLYRLGFGLLQQVTDYIAGLPLVAHDKFSLRHPRLKLTDYLFGNNGTLFFSLDPTICAENYYDVGLASERNKIGGEIIPQRPFIFNTQGSTYHQDAWSVVQKAASEIPHAFSIHVTGKKEDTPQSIPGGKIIGYEDGFILAGQADIVINHGGFGTISQWLLSVGERLIEERENLRGMLTSHKDTKEINRYLQSLQRVSRSISICNTFEQENNSRILQGIGGEVVCSVLIADELIKHQNPEGKVKKLIETKLALPLDDKEKDFWVNLVRRLEYMNASTQIALILERKMFGL